MLSNSLALRYLFGAPLIAVKFEVFARGDQVEDSHKVTWPLLREAADRTCCIGGKR